MEFSWYHVVCVLSGRQKLRDILRWTSHDPSYQQTAVTNNDGYADKSIVHNVPKLPKEMWQSADMVIANDAVGATDSSPPATDWHWHPKTCFEEDMESRGDWPGGEIEGREQGAMSGDQSVGKDNRWTQIKRRMEARKDSEGEGRRGKGKEMLLIWIQKEIFRSWKYRWTDTSRKLHNVSTVTQYRRKTSAHAHKLFPLFRKAERGFILYSPLALAGYFNTHIFCISAAM